MSRHRPRLNTGYAVVGPHSQYLGHSSRNSLKQGESRFCSVKLFAQPYSTSNCRPWLLWHEAFRLEVLGDMQNMKRHDLVNRGLLGNLSINQLNVLLASQFSNGLLELLHLDFRTSCVDFRTRLRSSALRADRLNEVSPPVGERGVHKYRTHCCFCWTFKGHDLEKPPHGGCSQEPPTAAFFVDLGVLTGSGVHIYILPSEMKGVLTVRT